MASITIHEGPPAGSPRPLERLIHPGSGRRKAPVVGKGRQLDDQALTEVRATLGAIPRRRDLLIEHLHLLQDEFRGLFARHLVALADELRLPMAEVFETASFYAHFDIIMDEEPAPAKLTLRVCDGITCEMMGGQRLLGGLRENFRESDVRVVRAPCMGRCAVAPTVEVGHAYVDQATVGRVAHAVETGCVRPDIAAYKSFETYLDEGGYELLEACYRGERNAEEIVAELKSSGLRGLGGAGFPAGKKWEIIREQRRPRLLAVNGDEGEPGTFKDRFFLESDPHRFLEGTLLACWACEIQEAYLYVRDEYPGVIEILRREIPRLEFEGLTRNVRLHLRRGAGAYICGEESAMLESIEGKRGLPRHKPPFPTEVGLFGKPTLAHNIGTLYWVRDIVEKGADWFAGQGRHGRKGLRSFSVSGRVREPGIKLAPAGITLRELIDEYCGGMAEGHVLKAYLPGGASGGILPAHLDNVPLDFDTLQEHGCFIGSAAIVVFSHQDDMKAVALNLMRFFEDESCGQCTPCRNGTEKAVKLMEQPVWDTTHLEELSATMMDASICGLGQAAPNPVLSVIKHFSEEVTGGRP
ncbi:MAG: NADH-ubiquinone oxidoreductase-F iron-sulfur binding region domain-containing protein [Geminicoccaceae bacterium]